jgi:hypothetical protein
MPHPEEDERIMGREPEDDEDRERRRKARERQRERERLNRRLEEGFRMLGGESVE